MIAQELDKNKMNRLIWGDNLLAMQALLAQGYGGKIDLIYIDPPFASSADYNYDITIEGKQVEKQASIIERLAYTDTWEAGLDSYLDMMYPRLQLMKRLLSEQGSIYIHVDWRVNSHLRILLDEIFGADKTESQIIWQRVTSHSDRDGFGINYDIILQYSKSGKAKWNQVFAPYDETYLKSHYKSVDPNGRRFELADISAAGAGTAKVFLGKLIEPPKGTHWRCSNSHFEKNNRIFCYLNRELVFKHHFLADNYHPKLGIDRF